MQAMEIQALSVCAHYFSQQGEREREREREAACRQQRLLQSSSQSGLHARARVSLKFCPSYNSDCKSLRGQKILDFKVNER